MPQKLHRKTFYFSTVVPSIVLPDFFNKMEEAIKNFSDWQLGIYYAMDGESMSQDDPSC